MVCQPLRLALLIGAITAVAVSPVRASFWAPRCCESPCSSSPCGTTAPAFRTVTCTEWVKENVTTVRKAYKYECRTEACETWRTECVPVCTKKVITVTKRIPVCKEEIRNVCHKETVYETRTVNKTCYKNVSETCMKKHLVRLGHWECKEVTPLFGGGGGLFSGHGHCGCDSGCSDACNSCRPTRTRKVWVNCPEYKECPVTVCKKVAVCEPVTCQVAVCKNVMRQEKVMVRSFQCVQEQQTVNCTTYETRKVKCVTNRTVRVCVPYDQTVTCCKWVQKTVCRQVPVTTCCSTGCDSCERGGFLSGLRDRLRSHGDCCRSSCDSCSSCK